MLKILQKAYLNGDEQHSAAEYEDILKKAIDEAGCDVWLDQSGDYYELKDISEMPLPVSVIAKEGGDGEDVNG